MWIPVRHPLTSAPAFASSNVRPPAVKVKPSRIKHLDVKRAAGLAALFVPRAGIEPARPFRAKGFSYHYGFRHHLCLWSGLFLHRGAGPFRCVVSSLCTFLFSEAWLKIAIGLTRYGFLEFTTFYISLFRECTQIMFKSLVSTIPPPRQNVGLQS